MPFFVPRKKTNTLQAMTPTTRTELMDIAKQAAEYIGSLNGESETFQIDGDTLTAVITYNAEIGYEKGDYFTAPAWWVESERVTVKSVYNDADENDTEAAEWLAKQMN